MTDSVIRGKVCVVGDYVSGDVILPARHAFLDAEGMAAHVLEELDPAANARVRAAPILVAGMAFGYGTGRESSARAVKAAGVKVVIGGPFARIFYRNAINNGLLVLDCPELTTAGLSDGAEMEIDTGRGVVCCAGRNYAVAPVPDLIRRIVEAGDLVEYGRRVVAEIQAGTDNG
jgi:3-isopropylmalate/(R)-2-methylmalate dehydratase small subunit